MTSQTDTRWFITAEPDPAAELLLFCLPPAGGGASGFWPWRAAFPPSVDVQPVQLPGRENRMSEPPGIDPAAVAAAIAARADRPFAIYGHSMGALIALEATRALAALGAAQPVRCYVAASRPPHQRDPWAANLHGLSDDEFLAELHGLGGVPAELMTSKLRQLVIPVLRADFGWLASCEIGTDPELTMPLVAFAGQDDPLTGPDRMTGWERYSQAGFTLNTLPGGHFFPATGLAELAARIVADCAEWTSCQPWGRP